MWWRTSASLADEAFPGLVHLNGLNGSLQTTERLRNSAKHCAKKESKLSRRSAGKRESRKVMRQPGVWREKDFAQYFLSSVFLTRSVFKIPRHVFPPPRPGTFCPRSGFRSRVGVD